MPNRPPSFQVLVSASGTCVTTWQVDLVFASPVVALCRCTAEANYEVAVTSTPESLMQQASAQRLLVQGAIASLRLILQVNVGI